MAPNFQNILVIIFLCVAVLFITGIAFPKYLSNEYLKLRTILNCSVTSSALVSDEKLAFVGSEIENSKSKQSVLVNSNDKVNNIPNGRFLPSVATDSSRAVPIKIKKRIKRRVSSNKVASEFFAWNFNLNVTRYENLTMHEATKNYSNTSMGNKNADVAIYVKSQGPRETALSELRKNLKSVGTFITKLFSIDVENVTKDSVDVKENQSLQGYLRGKSDLETSQNFTFTNSTENMTRRPEEIYEKQIAQSFKESLQSSELQTLQSRDMFSFSDDESGNESLIQTGREGRIFFGIFKFGGRRSETTPVFTTEAAKSSTEVIDKGKGIKKEESSLHSVLPLKSEFVTDNSQREASFHSESLSKTEHTGTDLNKENTTGRLPLQLSLQKHNSSDSTTDGFELPAVPNKISNNLVPETTLSTEPLFTDEILKNFCGNLLNNLEESQLLSKFEGNGLDSEINVGNTKDKIKSSPHPLLDHAIIEDTFLISSSESPAENKTLAERLNRFFNVFGFGSGRSEILEEESDSIEGQADILKELGNLPSVSDCERFFVKKQINNFSKPNLIDIEDFNSKLSPDFVNATLPSKLQEQQLQLTRLNNSIQTFGNISGGENETKLVNQSDLSINKGLFVTKMEKPESDSTLNDKFVISISTDTDSEVTEATEGQRDGRIFNFLGFWSGNGAQEEKNRSESRLFLDFFGSGGRSLDTSDEVNELNVTSNFGSRDFEENTDFSEDEQILSITDVNYPQDFSTTSVEERRFLGVFGFVGSGDGRELPESTELNMSLKFSSDKLCGDNCSHNVTEQFNECDNHDCDFGNSRDEIIPYSSEFENSIPLNKSDCLDDYYPCTNALNGMEDVDGNLTNKSISDESKNLTQYFHENYNFLYNFTGGNETYPECDDCNSNAMEISDAPSTASESPLFTETTISKSIAKLNEYENDCNDCDYESNEKRVTEAVSAYETLKSNYQTDAKATIMDLEYDSITTVSFHSDKRINGNDYRRNATPMQESLSDATENTVEKKTTEMKIHGFMGTIFLTGSGDGGLFGNDGGPINLAEESTIRPVVPSRRRGRLVDSDVDACDDCVELSSLLKEINLDMALNNRSPDQLSSSTSSPLMKIENVSRSPERKHKVEEATSRKSINRTEEISFSSVTIINTPSLPLDVSTAIELQPRFCTGARDCNVTLNERCITVDSSPVCDCGRTFVRHKETGKCVVRRHVETSLKLPAEGFDANLKNPDSIYYKQMSEKSLETMWLLLNETPEVLRIVADINVAGFTSGSLIIRLNLVLAVGNESEAKTINSMEDKLQRALQDEHLVKRASLNIRNASVLSITIELNPCKSTELNYCSKNAFCVPNEAYLERFTCYCKEHYRDVSTNSFYPGEMCIDKCSPTYCGLNGHCEISENEERRCLCNGLYFGERCEIPGMVILGSLSVAACISIVILCAIVFRIRCRTRSYGRTPTFRRSEEIGPHVIANGRVSDAIALGESKGAKVSKFSHISTPMYDLPVIKVTRPTLNESSISFDYDASFDASPTSVEAQTTDN